MKRRIACISDTHCASFYGLCPPAWKNSQGNIVTQNNGQQALWDFWLYFVGVCRDQKIDTVIADGDLIHGQNPKSAGVGVYTNDLAEQAEIAQDALRPLMQLPTVRRRHFIQGSGYHVDRKGAPIERYICNHFKGKWHGFIANLQFKGTGGLKAHIIHGGSGAYIYRSQVLDRRNLHMNAAAGVGSLPRFDIMIRGHWHFYQYIDINDQHIIQLPCWCLYIPAQIFTEKYPMYQPSIGGVITIDDDNKVHVEKYVLPHNKIPKTGHELKGG